MSALDPVLFRPNGIGLFQIGVSPVGTRPLLDPNTTILSQYSSATSITELIGYFEQWFDPTELLDNFYDWVMNVETAQGWGLDVWGRIVGVVTGRILTVSGTYLGFEEAGPLTAEPFYHGVFYNGPNDTSNVSLTDDAFRQLIYAKALANICDGSITGINQVLLLLFPNRGVCYVDDLGDMTMRYVFEFDLTPVELAIIQQTNILPKPVGVSSYFTII